MKANELRLGNYVKTQIHGVGIVEAISGLKILYSRNYDSLDVEDFEPIPLNFEDFMSIDEDDFLADKTGFVIFKNSYAYQFTYEDYKYTHQLQNLYFALTNKELTIK